MNRNVLRCMLVLGMLYLPFHTVWAEAVEQAPVPMPAPMMPTSFLMLVMLGLVLDILLLVAVAYLWLMWRRDHLVLRQMSKLLSELKDFAKDLQEAQQPMMDGLDDLDGLPMQDLPEPIKKDAVWEKFVEEFNQLAADMKTPGAGDLCEKFVAEKKISLLMCLDHAAEVDGQPSPKFVSVKSVPVSAFWAWPMPGAIGRYAVVPNPYIPYEKKLHEEGGMKETFASNFESGVYRKIEVRMPAIFRNSNGNWRIDQPGIIRVEP